MITKVRHDGHGDMIKKGFGKNKDGPVSAYECPDCGIIVVINTDKGTDSDKGGA